MTGRRVYSKNSDAIAAGTRTTASAIFIDALSRWIRFFANLRMEFVLHDALPDAFFYSATRIRVPANPVQSSPTSLVSGRPVSADLGTGHIILKPRLPKVGELRPVNLASGPIPRVEFFSVRACVTTGE